MAYEGVGGVGYLLGTLLGKAFGGKTAQDRERERKAALGEYAKTNLFEQPLTEGEAGLFESAPLEAFQLGVKREDERRRLRQKMEDEDRRFGRQKELVEFTQQKQKEYSTSGAGAQGLSANQIADARAAADRLETLAAKNPEIRAILEEARSGNIRDAVDFEGRVRTHLGPLMDEEAGIRSKRGAFGIPSELQGRAAELAGVGGAREALYLMAEDARRRAPVTTSDRDRVAPQGVTSGGAAPSEQAFQPQTQAPQGSASPRAAGDVGAPPAPRRPLTPVGAQALAKLSQSSGSFETALKTLQERPEALLALVPGTTPEDWAAAIEARYGRALPEEEGLRESSFLEKAGDVAANTLPEAAPILPAVGGALAGRAAGNLATRTGSALLGRLAPALGPAGALASGAMGVPPLLDQFLYGPMDEALTARVAEQGEVPRDWRQASGSTQPSPQAQSMMDPGLFAQPGAGGMEGQGMAPSLFSGPDALAGDELAAIQDFLIKEEQRRRIEKLMRILSEAGING